MRSFFAATMLAETVGFVALARSCFGVTVSPTLTFTAVTLHVPPDPVLAGVVVVAEPVVGASPNARLQLVAAATLPVAATSLVTSATAAVEVR